MVCLSQSLPLLCTLPCKQAAGGAGHFLHAPGPPWGNWICFFLVSHCRAAAVQLEVSRSLFLSVIGNRAQKACKEGPRALQMDVQGDAFFSRQGKSLLICKYAQLRCGLRGKSFPFSLCAKLRVHCSLRARQSHPPPAAPGSEQTGEGASFMAGTRSQTECCVISHILWALLSWRPEVPMEAKGSLSLTTQQTNLGPWARRGRLCCHLN